MLMTPAKVLPILIHFKIW